jgi:hypothetical protein
METNPRLSRSLEGLLNQIAREARFGAWAATPPQWGWLISVSGTLFAREVEQPVAVVGYASRAAIPGELVRINLDFVNVEAYLAAFKSLLRKELEPFIIGVGEIRTRETANSLIILSGDTRQEIRFSDHLRFAS